MAKICFGVQDLPKLLKKLYVGDNDVAKTGKKVYVGDSNGIARWGYSAEEKLRYREELQLPHLVTNLAGASLHPRGDVMIFGGGKMNEGGATGSVSAYNTALTRSSLSDLTVSRYRLAAASVGNCVIFAGGTSSGLTGYGSVDAYDSTLTKVTISNLYNNTGGFDLAGTATETYALFAGGYYSSSTPTLKQVDAYNQSLTHTVPELLSYARRKLAAVSLSDYIFFGGGEVYVPVNYVDVYNKSLTRSYAQFTDARTSLAATSVGNYVLFAGGHNNLTTNPYTYPNTVEVYNNSLTHSLLSNVSIARDRLTATTLDKYAMFAGGNNSSGDSDAVDVFDASLVHTRTDALPLPRYDMASASFLVNQYRFALFAGGYKNQPRKNVYVYEIA